jgi:ribosomal-protein-alanine N-acetyltransferase
VGSQHPPVLAPMAPEHVDAVWAIERSVFPSPWSRASFERESVEEGAASWVALLEGRVIGYLVSWVVYDELHIGNIAVTPESRGRGVGRMLLAKALEDAAARGAVLATLEARESNARAIGLYESFGFRPVAIRKRYYADSGEDAIVMIAELGGRERP